MVKEFLISKVEDNYFAIDIFNIEQIVKYESSTRIVGSPSSMIGVSSIFNKLWNIVDLQHLFYRKFTLGNKEQINSDVESKVILLRDKDIGLLVEEVFSIEKVNEEDIKTVELKSVKQNVINLPNILASIVSLDDIFNKIQD